MSKVKKHKPKTVTVSKAQVMKAIATEPNLTSNTFISQELGEADEVVCKVCAVGAVLRSIRPEFNSDDGIINCTTVSPVGLHRRYAIAAGHDDSILFERASPLGQISTAYEYAYVEAFQNEGIDHFSSIELARLYALFIAEAFCPSTVEVKFAAFVELT
jgi:hypothetical protein